MNIESPSRNSACGIFPRGQRTAFSPWPPVPSCRSRVPARHRARSARASRCGIRRELVSHDASWKSVQIPVVLKPIGMVLELEKCHRPDHRGKIRSTPEGDRGSTGSSGCSGWRSLERERRCPGGISNSRRAPNQTTARSKRGSAIVLLAIAMVVVIVALILTYVPLESTALTKTADTNDCGDSSPCPEVAVEFTVGDSRFATLTGTWVSSSTGEDILVTINNGPSDQACTLCSDLLYTSLSSSIPHRIVRRERSRTLSCLGQSDRFRRADNQRTRDPRLNRDLIRRTRNSIGLRRTGRSLRSGPR